eukprot:4789949-Ditylum_brightwellii.AAC.1
MDTEARPDIALEVSWGEDALREVIWKVASRRTGGKVVINMEHLLYSLFSHVLKFLGCRHVIWALATHPHILTKA